MKRLIALLFFALAPLSAEAQIAAPSTWVNDKGSTLIVETFDSSTMKLSGKYINSATGFECQGKPYEVAGDVKGNRIDFYVNWKTIAAPDCRTITVWSGRLLGDTITTRWKLIYVGSDWKFHTITGRDIFTKK